MTCRLHLRHFSSTPSSTTRASKLPQQQRKDVDCFDASLVLARIGCKRGCIYAALWRSLANQNEVMTKAKTMAP